MKSEYVIYILVDEKNKESFDEIDNRLAELKLDQVVYLTSISSAKFLMSAIKSRYAILVTSPEKFLEHEEPLFKVMNYIILFSTLLNSKTINKLLKKRNINYFSCFKSDIVDEIVKTTNNVSNLVKSTNNFDFSETSVGETESCTETEKENAADALKKTLRNVAQIDLLETQAVNINIEDHAVNQRKKIQCKDLPEGNKVMEFDSPYAARASIFSPKLHFLINNNTEDIYENVNKSTDKHAGRSNKLFLDKYYENVYKQLKLKKTAPSTKKKTFEPVRDVENIPEEILNIIKESNNHNLLICEDILKLAELFS